MMKNIPYPIQAIVLKLNYVLLILIFLLNLYPTPYLKYLGLAYSVFVCGTIFICDFPVALQLIISFSFYEGQNRVLWNFHSTTKLIFDIILGIGLVRSLIKKKKIEFHKTLPKQILVLLALYFSWYLVELFNPYSVSPFAAVAATKIYLFPVISFLIFRINEEAFNKDFMESIRSLCIFLVIMQIVISIYQLSRSELVLLGISSNYSAPMKQYVFTGKDFRPFGTTHLPGLPAIYLYLTAGFLFLRKKLNTKHLILLILIIATSLFTIFICQVRSAMIKYVLEIILIIVGLGITSQKTVTEKYSKVFKLTSLLTILCIMLGLYLKGNEQINFETAQERWKKIQTLEDFKSRRAGPRMAMRIAHMRLNDFPIGIGPGLTGAASSVSQEQIQKEPIYNKDTFWGYDNFYLSLFVEFGYGAIIYILFLISLPVMIFSNFIQTFRKGNMFEARVKWISLVHVCVILIGNWGAIGLPYNPESFFFWLWTAIAFNFKEPNGGPV